jgi:hypothetical protein
MEFGVAAEVRIVIGMILFGERVVGRLDFLLTCQPGDAEDGCYVAGRYRAR